MPSKKVMLVQEFIEYHKDELLKIMDTDVSAKLQDTKDAFLVQCAFGCRVSDFQKMGMHTIAVSDEGIPYIHYILFRRLTN